MFTQPPSGLETSSIMGKVIRETKGRKRRRIPDSIQSMECAVLDSRDYGRVNWQSIEYEGDDCQEMYEEDRFEWNNRQNRRWEEKKR